MRASNSKQKPAPRVFKPKPLSVEQETSIELLLTGKCDREVGELVGVTRWTVQQWRTMHPVFVATLEQRRAEVWGTTGERLRALMSKAVENIAVAIEGGNLPASWEPLRCVGIHGVVQPIGETDPEKIMHQQMTARLDQECPKGGIMEEFFIDQQRPGWHKRKCEIEAELWDEYGEEA
jgi:hypothetical protein